MRRSPGFTLIELLVVLGLMGIILTYSVISCEQIIKKNQLTTRVDELTRIIQFAKTQSLSSGNSLILMPIKKSWSNGVVLLDRKSLPLSNVEQMSIIHEWRWPSSTIAISWHGFTSNNYLLFSQALRANAVNGYFLIQSREGRYKLILNRLARVTSI